MIYQFRPDLHPRDRLGRFMEILGKMKPGDTVNVTTPLGGGRTDRVSVEKRRGGTYRLRKRGGRTVDTKSADYAAKAGLTGLKEMSPEAKRKTTERVRDSILTTTEIPRKGPATPGYESMIRVRPAMSPGVDRDAANAERYPLGTPITTEVARIGGNSDIASGEVVDHKYGKLAVKTEAHGTIMVSPDDVIQPPESPGTDEVAAAVAQMRADGSARPKGKPFPGMGNFVVIGKAFDGDWQAFEGAATEDAARKKSALYSQYPDRLIVPNEPPAPQSPGTADEPLTDRQWRQDGITYTVVGARRGEAGNTIYNVANDQDDTMVEITMEDLGTLDMKPLVDDMRNAAAKARYDEEMAAERDRREGMLDKYGSDEGFPDGPPDPPEPPQSPGTSPDETIEGAQKALLRATMMRDKALADGDEALAATWEQDRKAAQGALDAIKKEEGLPASPPEGMGMSASDFDSMPLGSEVVVKGEKWTKGLFLGELSAWKNADGTVLFSVDLAKRASVSPPQSPGTPELADATVSDLAAEIRKDWKNVNFAAKPYLDAMDSLGSVDDQYFMDDGRSIVSYFLSNASSWRGERAAEIKAELKRRLGR